MTQVIVLIISGLIYLGLDIFGFAWAVNRKSNSWVVAYFVSQLLIGGLIVYLGKGFMWLVLLPLASHSVYLSLPGTLSVCFFILAEELLQYLPSQGWLSLVSRLTDFLAAVVFVAVFTRISLSEEKARSAFCKAQTLTQEALTDIRRSVASLRADPVSTQSLSEAVEGLLIEGRASGLVTSLRISSNPRKLNDQAEFTLQDRSGSPNQCNQACSS